MNVTIEPLDAKNWYHITQLSVSEEQKKLFRVSNVYWIGSSRYEEKNELFAIKLGEEYVGVVLSRTVLKTENDSLRFLRLPFIKIAYAYERSHC